MAPKRSARLSAQKEEGAADDTPQTKRNIEQSRTTPPCTEKRRRSLRLYPADSETNPSSLDSPPKIPHGETEIDEDSSFTAESGDKIWEEPATKKVQTPKPVKEEVLAELKKQGFPDDLFTLSAEDVDWISLLLQHSTATPETTQDIREFINYINRAETAYPTAIRDPVAFVSDVDRKTWHTHCPNIDALWEAFLTAVKKIIGDNLYMFGSLAKPSGPLGAILYFQWYVYFNSTII
jgi:hypothetical protein